MLQEIHIAGHSKGTLAKLLSQRPNELHALIITNHDHEFPEWIDDGVISRLHLAFDDLTLPRRTRHYVLPSEEHVRDALEWAEDKESLVVACHAGVSRSSAMAYLIACQAWGCDKALSVISPRLHDPNPLIVRHGSKVLNMPEVWNRFVGWSHRNLIEIAKND